MTSECGERDEGAQKICLRHSHLCARVTVKDYKLFARSFQRTSPLPVRRASGSSALVVHAAAHSQPDRGNERVLQFALDAIIALLELNKLFRPGLCARACAGEEVSRSREGEGARGLSSDTHREVNARRSMDPRLDRRLCENC